MSQFDASDYFNRVAADNLAARDSGETQDKYAAIVDAKQRAIQALNQKAAGIEARKKAFDEGSKNSLLGRIGVDPSSILGSVANVALATADEAKTLATELVATPMELLGNTAGAESLRKFAATPGAVAPLLETGEEQSGLLRRAGDVGVAGAKSVVGLGDAVVGVGDIFTLGLSGKGWDALGRDSKATHKMLEDLYSPEQKLANKAVEDATGFLGTVDAMLDNPSSIPMGLIESLAPMLAGGAVGRELLTKFPRVMALVTKVAPTLPALTSGGAAAIGEGLMMAGSQAEGIRQETEDGRLSFKQALLAAGTGVIGAGVARLGNRVAGKLGVGDIDEALVAGALAKTKRGYTTSTILGAAIESGEEGLQTAAEAVLKNIALDKPFDDGDVGGIIAQGMMTAAPLGAAGGLGGRVRKAVTEQANAQTRAAAQEAAIASGDVTALVDPKKPTYDPAQAIAALAGNSSLPGKTSEDKEASLKKAGEIVADVRKAQASAQASYDMVSPEGQQANLDALNAAKARLAAETDPTKKAQHQADVDLFTVPEANATPAQIKAARTQLDVANKRLADATDGLTRFNGDLAAGSKVDVPAAIATINTPVDEKDAVAVTARSAAATSVINLSMAIPDSLTTPQAEALLKNTSNGLTETQRDYLRKFTEARVAAHAMKDKNAVAKEIYYGGNGNMGIVQHREAITGAIGSGNKGLADNAMAVLARFEEDHRTKVALAQEAKKDHDTTGKNTQVIRNQVTKAWERNTGQLLNWWGKNSAAKQNGAITFHPDTPNDLIVDFPAEAAAITAALAEMKATYAVKFSTQAPATSSATQGATNVPVVPQAPAPATPSAKPGVQQEGKDSGSAQPVVGSGAPAAAGSGTSEVGAAGVVVKESAASGYRERTTHNANSAGVTVAIAHDFNTAGEKLTRNVAGKRYIAISLTQGSAEEAGRKLADFMKAKKTSTLNVAGNGIYTLFDQLGLSQAQVNQRVFDIIAAAHQIHPITRIVSGGQTGVDIAGAVAAQVLGIPAEITLPKGFVQRDKTKQDRKHTLEEIKQQISDGVAGVGVGTTTPAPAAQSSEAKNSVDSQAAPAAVVTGEATDAAKVSNQSTESTGSKEETTPSESGEPTSKEAVIDAERVYEEAVTDSIEQLTSDASSVRGTTVDAGLLSENADLETLLDLLGVNIAASEDPTYDELPSEQDLLGLQAKVIRMASDLKGGLITLGMARRSLAKLFAWYVPIPVEGGNAEREARAKKSADKYGNGNPEAHYLVQLTEELGEFLSEVSRLAGDSKLDARQLEIQKRALKALRFGEDTVNKGEGDYQGLTNKAAFEKAQQVAEPVSNEPTGKISILAQEDPEGTPYNLRNLIASSFTQEAGRDGELQRPLVAVKNFLTEGWDSFMEYLPIGKLSDDGKQLSALEAFKATATKWSETIRANLPDPLPESRAQYSYEDMMQFLLMAGPDGNLDIDENVKTAISVTGYAWVADAATSLRQSTDKAINGILSRGGKDPVSYMARDTLGHVGVYQHAIVDTLGSQVMTVLGLKLKPDASLDAEARLRTALGLHVLKLLEDQGLITRTTIMGDVMGRLREEGMSATQIDRLHEKHGFTNPNLPHYFFAVARNSKGRVTEDVQAIFEANRGSQSVLDKLFGVVSRVVLPSLSPITTVQRTTSGTKQRLPKELEEAILLKQSRARVVRKDKMELLGNFSETEVESLIGIVEESDHLAHVVNRLGNQAKNEGLRREYRLFVEYVGEYLATAKDKLDTQFYLPFDVWKQQRVGIEGSTVNPQTSKIVRYLIGSPAWTTEIDPANETLMNSFYLRVGEGLGVKTERADNQVSIDKIKAMLATPIYADAIQALIKSVVNKQENKQEMTAEEKASVVAAVAKGGENLHTLDALIGVAYQQAALVDGVQQKFTVQIMGEVDGVANGTMLNHVLMGAGSQAMLNQGGFFEIGHPDKATQYNQWRGKPGNLDVYETTARKIFEYIQGMYAPGPQTDEYLANIWAVAGKLFDGGAVTKDGRNLVKDALNPVAFGASLESMVTGMSRTFLASVYGGFEKWSVDKASQADVDMYVAHVNNMIRSDKDKLPVGLSIAEYMELELSDQAAQDVQNTFIETVGEAATEVVKQEFGTFIARRDGMNATINFTHGLYAAVYQGEREAYVQELLEKGEIEQSKTGRINDLSPNQEAELEKRLQGVLPVIQTSMSKKDKTNRNSGLRMGKTKRRQSDDPVYTSKVQFGTPIKGVSSWSKTQKRMVPQMSTNLSGIVTVTDAPGVAMGSAVTHSSDSAALLRIEMLRDILGVHDAAGDGVGGLRDTARALNKALWDTLLDYSPIEEAYQAMARVVDGIATMQAAGTLSPQSAAYLKAFLQENAWKVELTKKSSNILTTMLVQAKAAAYQADLDKFTLMQNWIAVDQYAYQGGNYLVTKEDRAAAAKKLTELKQQMAPRTEEILAAVEALLAGKPVRVVTTPASRGSEEVEENAGADSYDESEAPWDFDDPNDNDEVATPPKVNPFGTVGTPVKSSNPELLSFFKQNPEPTGAEVAKHLYNMMEPGSYTRLLAGLLRKAMPADIKVMLVRKDTVLPESKMPRKEDQGKAFGWKTGNEVYILSDDFVNTGLQTPEVLLHELVHAVLQHVIASPRGAEVAMIAALTKLMEQAKKYAQDNGITKFDAALNDLDEFVAYGMTRESFQKFLAQVTVTTPSTGLVDGFKEFVKTLVGLLFARIEKTKTQEAQAMTALAGLIENVTGLLQSATEEQAELRDAGTLPPKSMAAASLSESLTDTRSIMAMLGFKSAPPQFAELSAKLLTNPDINIAAFVKDSAQALSHMLMKGPSGAELRAALDTETWRPLRLKIAAGLMTKGMMRGDALVEAYRVITQQALMGELAARTKAEQSVVARLMQAVEDFIAAFKNMAGSKEFTALVRTHLNGIVEVQPGVIKNGYAKVSFQQAVDGDPQSAQVLAHMSKLKGATITGSIVLAETGTIYRNAQNMLHDLDFVVDDKEAAESHLRSRFPGAVQVYNFKTSQAKVDSYLVPPMGSEIVNIVREFGEKGRVLSFEVQRNGVVIGRTWNDVNGEQKTGQAGTFVDFFTETANEPVTSIPFTVDGNSFNMAAASAAVIFDAKLQMGRPKDMNDYALYVPKYGNPLGRERAPGTSRSLSMATPADPVGAVNNYTTLDIHNALNAGSVTPEFDAKLRNVLGGIVEKLYGPFQVLKPGWMKNQAMTAVDTWHKALATGQAPFAYSVSAAPFVMSEQEAHAMEQVETTVRVSLERDETGVSSARTGLDRLFTEAMSILKPSDFATVDEYNYIFDVAAGTGNRSEHLARFAAFGLANQQVNKLLQVGTKKRMNQTTATKTFGEKLNEIWEAILNFFHEKVTKTYAGQQADAKLLRLVDQLVDIEAKRRMSIARRAGAINFTAPLEAKTKKVVEAGLKKVSALAGSKMVAQSSNNFVRATGSMVRLLANNQVEAFVDTLKDFRAQQNKERYGLLEGTLNYAQGGDVANEALLRERKVLEGARKDIITGRAKDAKQAFVNGGKDLSPSAMKSITQVFMRTGAYFLWDQFSLGQIENMLGNQSAMNTEIVALEAQLSGFGVLKDDYISQANSLAYYVVTGRNAAPVTMMNAHNIARMYGTPYRRKVSEARAQQAQPIIEKLVALYALGYTSSTERAEARKVLQKENARTDGNGVAFVLALHQHLVEKESKSRLFQGQEALMMHGFTSEIYSPHVEVVTATEDEGKALVRRGYKMGAPVQIDPAHPDQTPKHLYVLEGGGLRPYLTGIVSNDGKNAKGKKQHGDYMNPNTADGLVNASTHADIMHNKKRALAKGPRQDLSKSTKTYMAPVVNPQGEIVNWRYLMHSQTKDTILLRENRFDQVIGALAGSIFSKDTVTELNTRVFEAMKEQYDSEKARKSASYVKIGPQSPDPELREIWSRLPDESKEVARKIWGTDGMHVRNDQRDIIFGYRKLSLASAIQSTQDRRKEDAYRIARGMAPIVSKGLAEDFENAMAKFTTVALEHFLVLHARARGYPNPEDYAERAAIKVARGERMWQEIVAETKDLIVIKSVTVMMGNLQSNLSLLILSGVPIQDIVHSHLVAWRGATSYQKDSDELSRLQTQIDIKQTNGNDAAILKQIARLKDSMARNPVRELIEAGLMPTIVEDAAADEDTYSYKSGLTRKVDSLTSKLHPGVKTGLKNVYMAKDTTVYQGLRRITQLSDFMARYTQYQHLTNRQENPLSKEAAIQQSSEDFINYDVPMHRGMQYLDDMGIIPFMKYFLRIQKVLMRLTKDHPGRVLGAVALGQFLDLGPIVLESSWVTRIDLTPLKSGAFQYPGALDELATVNGALSLVGLGGSDWTPQ